MKISRLKTNEELEVSGVWTDIGDGAKVLIARENNTKYINALRSAMSPYRSKSQRSLLGEERALDIQCEVFADTILLDWKNIQDDDGKNILYTRENAIRLLREYKEFLSLIIEISSDIDRYKEDHLEEVKDNIKKS